jgi:hypothetical protein
MPNRFEQVDTPQPDALNLILALAAGQPMGRVVIPGSALPGTAPGDIDSGLLPPVDAFRAAVKLANEMKLAVVVIDTAALWQSEWGVLYREDVDDAAG